jgi:putative membrane protein insertion efficiency factor
MKLMNTLNKLLSLPLFGLIWLYQKCISPFLPQSCIYHPTCSEYTRQALVKHGWFWGTLMGIVRVLRCNPFFKGGIDEVPETVTFFKRRH